MIASPRDLARYVKADLARYDVPSYSIRPIIARLLREPQLRWQIRLRIAEYLHNACRGPLGRALSLTFRWRLQARAVRLGYTIGPNVFGPGLKLPHWGTIIVNPDARVGAGCTLHANTVIGDRAGVPTIGDNVYIGAGAVLYGPIEVGDGVVIAPNAVVVRSVSPHTTVGGIPAREMRRGNGR